MLNTVVARTRNPYTSVVEESVTFYIGADTEYKVRNIDGLGPVKANISTIESGIDPGGIYLSGKDGVRNIVITMGFDPDYNAGWSLTDIRNRLYEVFMPQSKVELEFTTEHKGVLLIDGIVESHEPVIFSKDPLVQISIICVDPYFRTTAPETVVNVPSEASDMPIFFIPFDGEVPVGFKMEYTLANDKPSGTILMSSLPREGENYFQVGMPFLIGDKVMFSTVKGDRYVRYIRNAATNNALPFFSGSLIQNKLRRGQNYFQFTDYGWINDLKFSYNKLYGGL